MTGNINTIILSLISAVTNGISTSQSLGASGNLTITGSLTTAGVATMDVARRIGITSNGNDSTLNWTITGTDRYGRVISEVLAGANVGTAQSINDYVTVTKISGSAATASTVTAGTTTVGSSSLIAIDYYANPSSVSANVSFASAGSASIEVTNSDPGDNWNFPNGLFWYTASGFTGISANTGGNVQGGPFTAMRLTVLSGTGKTVASIAQAMISGGL